jgi:diguanylate cyclase (GGDEF)-like protein
MRGWLYFGNTLRRVEPAAQPLIPLDLQEQQFENRVAVRTQELEKTVAELRARQLLVEARAPYDPLTGLANRNLLCDRFQCAVDRAKRSRGCFALIMIDLNGFKAINDAHGHAAGDAVLVAVAGRLQATLRSCDTASRLGGDEFALIVESIQHTREVAAICRKLVSALAHEILLSNGTSVKVGVSIGVALYPDDGQDLVQILSVADHAMYECKSTGHMDL